MATMPKAKTIPPTKDVNDQWLGRGCGAGVEVVGPFVVVELELKLSQEMFLMIYENFSLRCNCGSCYWCFCGSAG